MTDATTTTTTTAPPPPPSPPSSSSPPATPWYEGKVEAETIGFWQNKGYDLSDPVKVAASLTKQYREAEKLIGVPSDQLLRFPKDLSDANGWKAVYSRIGVPNEAKEYDFAQIKPKDGGDLDPAFIDKMRGALHEARVPKDRAPAVVKSVVEFLESQDVAEKAELDAYVQEQNKELERNWGRNYEANAFVAKSALGKLAAAAGMNEKQATEAWDALSKVGGVGAAAAMEMLRIVGSRMGEDHLVSGGSGAGSFPMTVEAARAEIESLKRDPVFSKRYTEGGVEEGRRMTALHAIAYPTRGRAA